MEGLTKQQLILLALLVSFVTSIATGIVTVSLMDQAPKSVTQTINRIVERTVEKVVPAENSASTIISKETVVVKSDDLVISSIEKNSKSLLRILKIKEMSGVRKEKFGGIGFPVGKKGLIASDISVLSKEMDDFGSVIPETYEVTLPSGKRAQIFPVGVDESSSVVFFEVRNEDGKAVLEGLPPSIKFGDSDSLKLGQSIVVLGGRDNDAVSTGIIASLVSNDASVTKIQGKWRAIKTDIKFADVAFGSPVINLSGEIVGIYSGQSSLKDSYLPIRVISDSLSKVESSKGNFVF
jgi:S1-C subfamily serine protease